MQSSRPLAANLPPAQVDSCIYFPAGLVGCSTWKRFVLLSDAEEDLPVAALQCLDERGVTFMVTDPVVVSSEYEAPLSAGDRAELGLDDETKPVVYCTLTVGDGGELTANLLGPLVINPTTRKGKQLVLADSGYSACHPVGNMGAE